jgi:lactoylglutathione lyase
MLSPVTAAEATNLRLHLHANDIAQAAVFYGDVLGLADKGTNCFAVGASEIQLTQHRVAPVERVAVGYRYMTMQVFDVVATHAKILQLGGTEGMAPIRLGEVAYISFVCDPDGNWIEISQRKSITGSLD